MYYSNIGIYYTDTSRNYKFGVRNLKIQTSKFRNLKMADFVMKKSWLFASIYHENRFVSESRGRELCFFLQLLGGLKDFPFYSGMQ